MKKLFGLLVALTLLAMFVTAVPCMAQESAPAAAEVSQQSGSLGVIIDVVKWCAANWLTVLGAFSALAAALIPVFQIIPGNQPEKAMLAFVGWVSKRSRK